MFLQKRISFEICCIRQNVQWEPRLLVHFGEGQKQPASFMNIAVISFIVSLAQVVRSIALEHISLLRKCIMWDIYCSWIHSLQSSCSVWNIPLPQKHVGHEEPGTSLLCNRGYRRVTCKLPSHSNTLWFCKSLSCCILRQILIFSNSC